MVRLFFFLSCLTLTCVNAYDIVDESEKTKSLGLGDWYIHSDGELHLMQQLLRPNDLVFDVGANVGEWSLYALQVEPSIQLFSFEPLPLIYSDLKGKLAKYTNAEVFNLALSDRSGKANFCYYDETYDFSGLSGFFVREVLKADHKPPKIIRVDQLTLPDFCLEHNIDKIDFLKIDAEGAESMIIKGAREMIESQLITAIQFEYGGCYIDAKATLKEIYDLFVECDYAVFRIMPNGLIRIAQWGDHLEDFDLSNYVAVKRDALNSRLGIEG